MSARLAALCERVLERFGFAKAPDPDRAGLDALYLAWCRHVPFDNLRKRIALAGGGAESLPGGRPDDFLAAWLEHGTGGTCWPSSNGLFALLAHCGFDVRRISASMFDRNDHNHGSLIVRLDGSEWIADSSILCDRPIPFARSAETRLDDPIHPIRLEPAAPAPLLHWGRAGAVGTLACRLMNDPVDEAFYLERYEISRGFSVFNEALYARKNFAGRLVSFTGRTRHEKTPAGVTSAELSPEALRRALVEQLGYSEAIVARAQAEGGFAKAG